MKKSISGSVISFFLILLFFACSNSQNSGEGSSNVGMEYDNTLRMQFQGRFDSIAWTRELEPNLLADRKNSDASLFSSKSLNTVAAASVISVPEENAIYPAITGFGTIDIRGIPATLTSMITDFCNKLLNRTDNENDEMPVLFVSSQGSWIVVLYAALQNEAWKIEQIRYGDFVYE